MSSPTKDIKRLLKQIDETPVGPAERALIDRALVLAQEAGDDLLEYRVRMRLTVSSYMTGDSETTLSSWAWCLGKHDSDPRRFPFKIDDADLLWQYKWTSALLARNPRFPREQLESVLADMERRYREAGVGLSGVWQARLGHAMRLGDIPGALAAREAREQAGTDDYSHCEACVRSKDADLFTAAGDRDRALAVFYEIIEGEFSCGDEPEWAQAAALLSLLRAGRLDDAITHHRRGLALAKVNAEPFPLMSPHLTFCAVTGNEARGLALLERYLHDLPGKTLDAAAQFDALVSYGVLLDAVGRSGHGDTLVRGTDDPAVAALLGLPGEGLVTADVLAAASWTAAEQIAAAFDRRNGNEYHAGLLSQARALANERYDLPLGGEAFVADALPDRSTPADTQAWLDHGMEELVLTGDAEAALVAAQRAVDCADEALTPRSLGLGITALLALGRSEEAQAWLERRGRALRIIGDEAQAQLEERLGLVLFGDFDEASGDVLAGALAQARAAGAPPAILGDLMSSQASWLFEQDRPDEAVAVVEETESLLAGQGPSVLLGQCRMILTDAWANAGRIDEAAAVADTLLASETSRVQRMRTLRARAQLARLQGDLPLGLRCADELLMLTTAIGHRPAIADAAALGALLLSDADRDAEAAARQQVAIRHAQLADLDVTGLRFTLGRYQHWSGAFPAAVDTFEDVLAAEEAAGAAAGDLAETSLLLGHAAKAAEDYGRAYRAFSQAIDWADEAEAWTWLRDACFARGELLVAFDDKDALDDFTAALDAASKVGDPVALAHLHHVRGRAKVKFGDDSGLAELGEALELARANDDPWVVADIRDSQGTALIFLGRVREGVAVQLEAAALFTEAGDQASSARAELAAARGLRDAGDPAAAATVYRTCLAQLEAGTEAHCVVALEFGELLEGLGLLAEAEQVRSEVQPAIQ
jgi:tetratricopeptide (TPR) repeat protein